MVVPCAMQKKVLLKFTFGKFCVMLICTYHLFKQKEYLIHIMSTWIELLKDIRFINQHLNNFDICWTWMKIRYNFDFSIIDYYHIMHCTIWLFSFNLLSQPSALIRDSGCFWQGTKNEMVLSHLLSLYIWFAWVSLLFSNIHPAFDRMRYFLFSNDIIFIIFLFFRIFLQ